MVVGIGVWSGVGVCGHTWSDFIFSALLQAAVFFVAFSIFLLIFVTFFSPFFHYQSKFDLLITILILR